MHRKRTMSVVSMKSTGSDIPEVDETDELEIEIREKKCCHKPFIFKILQLNAPEKFWIILGCITSITFGSITPVSLWSFPPQLSEWSIVVSSCLPCFSRRSTKHSPNQTSTKRILWHEIMLWSFSPLALAVDYVSVSVVLPSREVVKHWPCACELSPSLRCFGKKLVGLIAKKTNWVLWWRSYHPIRPVWK